MKLKDKILKEIDYTPPTKNHIQEIYNLLIKASKKCNALDSSTFEDIAIQLNKMATEAKNYRI